MRFRRRGYRTRSRRPFVRRRRRRGYRNIFARRIGRRM